MNYRKMSNFTKMVDEGFEVYEKLQQYKQRDQDIKQELRSLAEKQKEGKEKVTLQGDRNKADVIFKEPSYSVKKDINRKNLLRLKALFGEDVISVETILKLKNNVTIDRIKEEIGEEIFNRFFEIDHDINISSGKIGTHLKERRKISSLEDNDLIENCLERKETTPQIRYK